MEKIIIGIFEDDAGDLQQLLQYLRRAEEELRIQMCIHAYDDAMEFLKTDLSSYDIFLINTSIPEMNIREFLEKLRYHNEHAYLLLTSETRECISIGYDFDAKNHFEKPFWYFKIRKELKKFLTCEHILEKPYIWMDKNSEMCRLNLNKLRFVETNNRSLLFHYSDRQFLLHGKLAELEKKLPPQRFFRCNNSYLVNIAYITAVVADVSRYKLLLRTGEEIPLSRSRKGELVKKMMR